MELAKTRLSRLGFAAVAIAALTLVGCSATPAAPPPSDTSTPGASLDAVEAQLYAQAKTEGALTIYSSANQTAANAMTAAFEAKFPGITVTYSLGNVSQNLTKLTQELSAGVHNADILALSAPGETSDFVAAGFIQPYKVHDYDKYPATARGDKDVYELYDKFTPYGTIVYNTNLMKAADVPDSYKAFANLNPKKYAGKIIMNDLTEYPYTNNLAVWQQVDGDSSLNNLKNLKIVTNTQATAITNGISSGQYLMSDTFNMQSYVALKAAGAPINFKVPKEGIWLQPGSHLLLKDAPHPAAAKLFMEYIYSAEGQKVWSAPGYVSPRPDVPLPAGLEWVAKAKVIKVDFAKTYAERDALTSRAKIVLGLSG
jgi:iron(III) transport system substrate-binding protein